MKIKKYLKELDIKSCIIGVLATILIIVAFNMRTLNAGQPSVQSRENSGHIVLRSLTVINEQGAPVFQLMPDSTGNGMFIMRNKDNMPLVLMRSVQDNDKESGMLYCNGMGIWGPEGRVSMLFSADAIQSLNY